MILMSKSKKTFGTKLRTTIEILNIVGFSALFVAVARLLPAIASREFTGSVALETLLGLALGVGAIYLAVRLKKKLHVRMETQHPPLDIIDKSDER